MCVMKTITTELDRRCTDRNIERCEPLQGASRSFDEARTLELNDPKASAPGYGSGDVAPA
jgi:hypothetical protein